VRCGCSGTRTRSRRSGSWPSSSACITRRCGTGSAGPGRPRRARRPAEHRHAGGTAGCGKRTSSCGGSTSSSRPWARFCLGVRPDPATVMRFVDEHRDRYAVALLLRVLGIAESVYYTWATRAASPCERADVDPGVSNIHDIWTVSGGNYGADRVHRQLRRDGVRVDRTRVERLRRRLVQHPPHPTRTRLPQPRRVRDQLAHPPHHPSRTASTGYRHAYADRRQTTTAPTKRTSGHAFSRTEPVAKSARRFLNAAGRHISRPVCTGCRRSVATPRGSPPAPPAHPSS
jgi:hypothetical protein